MTPQEHEKLQQFLSQLRQAQGIQRDPEADALISAAVSRQPDAAYLLVQRSLLQDQALEAAQARISELERQAKSGQPASTSSFLGSADAWGNSARTMAAPASYPERSSGDYPSARQGAYPQAGPGAYPHNQVPYPGQRQGGFSRFGGGMGGGGGSSFLGTMAATAAGVAGGAFLFQGIGNLLNQNDNPAGQEQGLASDAAGATPASDHSLAQEDGAMDNTAALDDPGMMDDVGGGDDSMV